MAPRSEVEDGIAIPPAPNWYGSALADWGVGCNDIYAYAARNAIVLLRPNGGGKGSAVSDERPAESSSSSPSRPDRDASFAGTLVGHHNRVTALAFARCPGVEHLLLSGSADRTVRLWDVADGRCVKILRGHAVDVTALATSQRVPDLAVSGDRSGKLLVWRFGGGADAPAAALEPLDASPVLCLAMSPHPFRDEVACGHQSGALGVYVLSGDDVVRKRLPARSGDAQACAWMPSFDESDDADHPPYNVKERGGDPPMVLAVGSREKAVTLWSWDGARTSLRKTLSLPRCPPHLSEAQRGRLWLSLAWSANEDEPKDTAGEPKDTAGEPKDTAGAEPPANARGGGRTVHLVTASHGGDLLRWTLDVHELVGSNSAGHVTNAPVAMDKFGPNDKAHARTVFTIRVKRGAAVTTSLDRSVSVWDVGRCERVWSTFGLGGFAYRVGVDPEDPFRASVACGDGSLRSLDLHHARGGGDVLWRGLPQTKATCAAWCPPAEEDGEGHGGRVAVGLEDGRVVVVDVGGQGRYAVQRDCHAGPAVAAQWIRRSGDGGAGGSHELWTLGEGRLWRWRSLALPEDRRKGKGAGDPARGGSGGIFEDVTDSLAGGLPSSPTPFASTFEWLESRDAGPPDFHSEPSSRLAVGWNDGRVSVHRRRRRETGQSDLLPGDDLGRSWTELWSAREHAKRVTAVRWHPLASAEDDDDALFPGWLAATSKDGSFLVYDGGGVVVRSPPSCRQALNDVAWAPGGAGAVVAVAGQDGLVRVVDVSFRPSLRAVMRGHDGSVLCVCWARVNDAGGTALLSGSDDQTLRRWDPEDPSHYPSAVEEKEKAERAAKAEGTAKADTEPSAASNEGGGEEEKDAPTLRGSNAKEPVDDGKRAKKKAKKASGGRGLLKAPAWESTPEGVAAGQAAAVDLARRLHGRSSASTAGAPTDDDECTYGPSGVGLYLGQEEATRLLALEERASLAADGGYNSANVPHNSASSSAGDAQGGDSPGGGGGAFRPAERAACAAVFRGDYVAAARIMLGSGDGPVPPDFLAACVGGGRDLFASVAREQADRLERRGEHQRAALLHLSLHDVVAALGSLRRGGFIRDAAALAASRLHPGDEVLVAVRRELAAAEETRGGMEAAAKAHLAAGRPAAAVRALTRRTLGGARAAAEVALTCGLRGEPERHAVLRAATECAEMGDVEGARSVMGRWREGTTEGEGGESEVEAAEAAIETLVVTRQVSLIDL